MNTDSDLACQLFLVLFVYYTVCLNATMHFEHVLCSNLSCVLVCDGSKGHGSTVGPEIFVFKGFHCVLHQPQGSFRAEHHLNVIHTQAVLTYSSLACSLYIYFLFKYLANA